MPGRFDGKRGVPQATEASAEGKGDDRGLLGDQRGQRGAQRECGRGKLLRDQTAGPDRCQRCGNLRRRNSRTGIPGHGIRQARIEFRVIAVFEDQILCRCHCPDDFGLGEQDVGQRVAAGHAIAGLMRQFQQFGPHQPVDFTGDGGFKLGR